MAKVGILMLLEQLVEKIGYSIRVRQLDGEGFAKGFAKAALPFTVIRDYDSRYYKVEYDDGRTGAVPKDVGFGRIHFGIFREDFVDGLPCSKEARSVCNAPEKGSIPLRSTNLKEEVLCQGSVLKTSSSTSSPQSSCGSPSGFLSWCRQLFGCWG